MAEPRDPLDLLLAEAGRERLGEIRDPAVWAAVVGVERVSLVAGTQDPGRLRGLLQGRGRDEVAAEVRRAWGRVAEALERAALDRGPDAATAHRDAGRHSVTTDAVLLRAALRAAHRTFEAEPYYRARYADRGARFAGTDSAWLVTLADLPVDGATGQTAWLARLLAGRGMPSWLLERHLEDLATEMVAVGVPAGSLVPAAESLRAARQTVLPDARLRSAADALAGATGEPEPLPGAAALALAAAADVATGVARSYSPCLGWLTDAQRCSAPVAEWLRGQAASIAPEGAVSLSAGRSRAGSRVPRS